MNICEVFPKGLRRMSKPAHNPLRIPFSGWYTAGRSFEIEIKPHFFK
jgi:hypothetical protein